MLAISIAALKYQVQRLPRDFLMPNETCSAKTDRTIKLQPVAFHDWDGKIQHASLS